MRVRQGVRGSVRADRLKKYLGWGQVMQGLQVLPRSSRPEEFGLYFTCQVELLEAFYPGRCSDACFKDDSSGRIVRRVGDQGRERRKARSGSSRNSGIGPLQSK